jgi:shikimate kinase
LKKPVFITGMPGSGKTTIGKLLAYDLSVPFYDLDKLIEQHEKKTIPAIFKEEGEEHFRRIENKTLLEFLNKHRGEIYVLSLGGGTVCFFDCIKTIKLHGVLIYLETEIDQLVQQLSANKNNRPVFDARDENGFRKQIENMLEKRKPFYTKANFTIQTSSDARITMADIVEIVGK